ncbi:MAG: hypothetical protein ABI903_00680 [Actinomycetota bacterium]
MARATDTDAGRHTSDKLLLGDDVSNAVITSGYGGLRLRGWVKVSGDSLQLDPAVEGIADVFGTASQWIQVSFLDGDQASSVLLVRGETLGVVLRPLESGVLEVAAIDEGADTESVSGKLIAGFMARQNAGTVTVDIESAGSSRSAAAHLAQGQWSFQVAVDGVAVDAQREDSITADLVLARFNKWLPAAEPPIVQRERQTV